SFTATSTTELYSLSLHDALPISRLRVRDVFHDGLSVELPREQRGFRAWSRPEHRCRGCRNGQDPHDDDRPRRCLRVHLWPEGADGGDRLAGVENHPSQSVTSTARITLRRRSPLPGPRSSALAKGFWTV